MSAANYIFIALFVGIFDESLLLVQLPPVEDNDIVTTEAAIRFTTNKLFSVLQLRTAQTTAKMKQYSRVHNYLMSLTLQDYHSLKEIAKLTRVDKNNIGNITTDFIALLNEIIDEEKFLELQNVIKKNDVKKDYDIVDEVQKFELLRTYYLGPYNSINKDILRVLEGEANVDSKTYNASSPAEATLAEVDTNNVINNDILQTLVDADEYNEDTKFTMDDDDHNGTDTDVDPFWHETDISISGRRIFKGRKARSRHFPFMASIQIFKKFQCGGSIIGDDLVITAASCLQLAYNNRFYRENPSFLSVRIGTQFFESGGDHIAVLEIYFYPSYNPHNLRHNLAVLRLRRRINFGKRAKKIELDKEAAPMPVNTDGVTIVGWGATNRGNIIHSPFISRMRYAIVDMYPLADCQEIYSKEYVTEKNFCAGYITSGTGACNRDVGGPGVAFGVLRGIISFGAPVCGTPDAPTVFTKVGYYYDWIEEIMDQEVPWAKQRTTKKANLTLFITKNETKPTTPRESRWTISPIYGSDTTPFVVPIHSTASPNDLRHLDRTLFKEFLKTMFNSVEIEEYLDTMKQTALPVKKLRTPSSNIKTVTSKQVTDSVTNSVPMRKTSPKQQQQQQQGLALGVDNRLVVKATRMVGVEPTLEPDSSSDSKEFMKNFTIISVAETTRGPKTTEGLMDVEIPANVESQANIENEANVGSQENVESQPNLESQASIEGQANIENQAVIDMLVNTDKPTFITNSTMIELFDLVENKVSDEDKELKNLVEMANEVDSTVPTTAEVITVSTEPTSTKPQDDKLIDEAILTLLYLSDSEKGNADKTLTNKNMAPVSVNQEEESDVEKSKGESADPDSIKVPSPDQKLQTFKDFTYRGDGKALQTFLSKNTDIFDILQEAMIEFNKTTKDQPQRVTRM